MRNTHIGAGKGIGATVVVALALLLAACGGGDSPEMTMQQQAQQRDEAAALQHAMQLARTANAAKVRGERAPGAVSE